MRDLRLTVVTLGFPHTLLIPSAALLVLILVWMRLSAISWMSGWARGLFFVAAGLAAWTLLEYLLHRFMLHGVDPFNSWHLQHHLHPDVPMRTPVAFSVMLVFALAVLPMLLFSNADLAVPLSCGLIIGHGLQEAVHHRLHNIPLPSGVWLGALWRHHNTHHHGNERAEYGTLTGFWDRLFNTEVVL